MDANNEAAGNISATGASDRLLRVGTLLHEFEIVDVIGEGGFSFVYLATDHSLQRTVALKEYMPNSLAIRSHDGTVISRTEQYRATFEAGLRSFVNEARLLAQFDHPALLKVYRFWEGNGTAYMAMPYYQGITIKKMVREHPEIVSEHWLKGILAPITDALEPMHAAHCYHRDISPDNIQLLKNGMPLLLDFGAARRIIGDMTQGVTVILKPGYAPLEQYSDDSSSPQGPWTDIYALAAVIYFCITGKAPPPSVARTLKDSLPSLDFFAGEAYSQEFLRAVERGLTVDPRGRPQSISEFRSLLQLSSVRSNAPISGWSETEHNGEARRDESSAVRTDSARGTPIAPISARPPTEVPNTTGGPTGRASRQFPWRVTVLGVTVALVGVSVATLAYRWYQGIEGKPHASGGESAQVAATGGSQLPNQSGTGGVGPNPGRSKDPSSIPGSTAPIAKSVDTLPREPKGVPGPLTPVPPSRQIAPADQPIREEAIWQAEVTKQEAAKPRQQVRNQEVLRDKAEAKKQLDLIMREATRKQEEAKKQEDVRNQEEAKQREEARIQEEARKQDEAKQREEVRKREEANKVEEAKMLQARQSAQRQTELAALAARNSQRDGNIRILEGRIRELQVPAASEHAENELARITKSLREKQLALANAEVASVRHERERDATLAQLLTNGQTGDTSDRQGYETKTRTLQQEVARLQAEVEQLQSQRANAARQAERRDRPVPVPSF